MTTLREAAQQALEALEKYQRMMMVEAGCKSEEGEAAIDTLRAALAEDAMQKFTDVNQELEAALAEPDRAQKMRDAGYTRRPTLREMEVEAGKDEVQAMQDALVSGVGILHGGKRIDPASIYKPPEPVADDKPFGYFRAEPFGWTDPTDEGAIPLYERPQIPPEAQTEAEKVAYCAGWWDALEKNREQK